MLFAGRVARACRAYQDQLVTDIALLSGGLNMAERTPPTRPAYSHSPFAHAIIGLTFFATRYATSLKPKRGQKREAKRLGLIQLV